jgi:PAS domain S-box-containing protein
MNRASSKIQKLEQRIEILSYPDAISFSPQSIRDLFEEFLVSLEEIRVANEELIQQNESQAIVRKELEAERDQYLELFDQAPDVYLVTDLEGNIQKANRAASSLLNVQQEFLVGKPLLVYIYDQDKKAFHTHLSLLRQGMQVDAWELRLQPRKSEPISMAISFSFMQDNAGKPVGLRCLLHDMKKQNQIEEALNESERKYRQLAENAQEGIWAIDLQANTTFANGHMAEMLGYTAEEMLGSSVYSFMDTHNIEICKRHFESLKQGAEEQLELEFIKKEGSGIYARCKTSLITDIKGNLIGILACIADISNLKRLNQELTKIGNDLNHRVQEMTVDISEAHEKMAASEEYLNKIINSIDDPIFVKDRQHRLVLVNNAECELAGRSRNEILGKANCDLLAKGEGHNLWEKEEEVLETGNEQVNLEQIIDACGVTRDFIIKKTLYADRSGSKFIIGIRRAIANSDKDTDYMIPLMRLGEGLVLGFGIGMYTAWKIISI